MPYKLKKNQPDFEPVEGPYANRKFVAGKIYSEIPPNESHRFDEIKETEETKDAKPESAARRTPRSATRDGDAGTDNGGDKS